MLVPLALTAAALTAFAATAAPAAVRDFSARGFTQVDLVAAADVTIRTGAGFSVHAEGDRPSLDHLAATVRNGVLVLGWTSGHWFHTGDDHVHVTITMPRASSVAVGGAGSITLDKASGSAFGANLSGTGSIRVAAIHAERTILVIGGSGDIKVAGNTGALDARASGVGSIDASALSARSGRIEMSGTGRVHARIDGPVDVSLSGVGDVVVDGNARCTVHKSGLGNVRCG